MTKPTPERWSFTFTPTTGDPVPPSNRIKQMLRYALRTCGLKVVDSGFEPAGAPVPPVDGFEASKTEPEF